MHVRRNVNVLRPGGARIRALKAGVRAMKDRSVFPRTTREAGPSRPPSTAPTVGRPTPRRKRAGTCVSMPASSFSPGTACTFTSSNAYCGRHPETPTWHFHTGTTQIPPSGRCRCRSGSRPARPTRSSCRSETPASTLAPNFWARTCRPRRCSWPAISCRGKAHA